MLLLCCGCNTLTALSDAFQALPEQAAANLIAAPLADLEALLGLLLRLVGF